MGMKRRKCDRCGKKRPFNEGTGKAALGTACSDGERFLRLEGKTAANWCDGPEGKICKWCILHGRPEECHIIQDVVTLDDKKDINNDT